MNWTDKNNKHEKDNIENSKPEYKTSEEVEKSKPLPVADPPNFEFNDLKKGQVKKDFFVVRNAGGRYKDFRLFLKKPGSFLKITRTAPKEGGQSSKLPMKVFFEAHAEDWSKRYSNAIAIKLDDVEELVQVDLDTQTKPVNDFARVLKPQNINNITALIDKLEKNTTVEIAVVTVDSFEGKTIEGYSNELFNEWGIGKEKKNNGILFLINPDENKYRIEVGKGLEGIIKPWDVKELFNKYAVPNFRLKKFGEGIILIIKALSSKITADYKQ